VVNIAIELNGQPPIQVYAKPSKEFNITLRSIDLGATEIVEDYEALHRFHTVGSPFSIPKAALVLCGFSPDFSAQPFASLREQLQALGCGIEITLLSAVPAGSGLGQAVCFRQLFLASFPIFWG
jgi:galactokinase